jgi:hypothetical protein
VQCSAVQCRVHLFDKTPQPLRVAHDQEAAVEQPLAHVGRADEVSLRELLAHRLHAQPQVQHQGVRVQPHQELRGMQGGGGWRGVDTREDKTGPGCQMDRDIWISF